MVFPSSSRSVTASSNTQKKKRSCELAKYSASTEKRGNMLESKRGRQCVSAPAERLPSPSTVPCNKPQGQGEPSSSCIATCPHMDRLSLAQYLSKHDSTSSLSPISPVRRRSSDSYQHLNELPKADIKRWYMRLWAPSCLKLGGSMTLHPNCQQVPDSYPTTSLKKEASRTQL